MMVLPERLEISVPPSVTSIAEAAVGRDTIMRAVASAVLQVGALVAASVPSGVGRTAVVWCIVKHCCEWFVCNMASQRQRWGATPSCEPWPAQCCRWVCNVVCKLGLQMQQERVAVSVVAVRWLEACTNAWRGSATKRDQHRRGSGGARHRHARSGQRSAAGGCHISRLHNCMGQDCFQRFV
jgi:hypothetical protein